MDRALWVLYSAVFLDLLGFGLMVPLLPFLAMNFGADAAHLGMMTTAFSGMAFVGNLALGKASDTYGRKLVLCGCLCGSAVSYAAFGLAQNLTSLIILRGLSGFFSGTIGTTQAWVASIVPSEERPQYMGYIGVCIGAGFAIGPGLGGILKQALGFEGPCFIAAGMCFLNFVAGCMYLKEPQDQKEQQQQQADGLAPLIPVDKEDDEGNTEQVSQSVFSIFVKYPQCLLICLSTCCYYAAFAGFESMGAIYFSKVYHLNEASFGYICTCSGLAAIVIQKYCVKPAIAKIGLVGACISAHAFRMAAYLVVLTLYDWSPYLMAVFIAGGSLLSSGSASILSLFSPEESRGQVLSMNQSFAALGRVIGPMLCSAWFAWSPPMLWRGAAGLCMFGALAVFAIKAITPNKLWKASSVRKVSAKFHLPRQTQFMLCNVSIDCVIPIPASQHWQFLVSRDARSFKGDEGGYFEAMFSHTAHLAALADENARVASSSVATAMFPPAAHVEGRTKLGASGKSLDGDLLTRSATIDPAGLRANV
mmetsp:Transcript_94346/g.148447  ORF Transcript_94346/g.148447 Transcript_94346/m.148447 type:complete len:534 (-) Transcript_94346:88-1689(-)